MLIKSGGRLDTLKGPFILKSFGFSKTLIRDLGIKVGDRVSKGISTLSSLVFPLTVSKILPLDGVQDYLEKVHVFKDILKVSHCLGLNSK